MSYVGYSASGDVWVAIVDIAGREEVVMTGQKIPGTELTVSKITPSAITMTQAQTKPRTLDLKENP